MIQFNLLPDVKLEFIKAQRTKHMVFLVATAVTALAIFIFALLFFTVNIVQKKHISNLDKDIQQDTAQLQSVQDLEKVLTVQNQLKALPELHSKKPEASRLYSYLIQLTPSDASISSVVVDFTANTITLSGSADKIETINKFVDTLKFTEYQTTETFKPFSNVVLTNFSVASKDSAGDKNSAYDITLAFNPVIFDSSIDGTMQVPKIVSTRSITEKPTDLFEPLPKTNKEEDN